MAALSRYRRRDKTPVAAVQLDLETEGFTYRKWGTEQRCKAGDWLVKNGDDTYTIDAEAFARTYRAVSPGLYAKVAPVWAEKAREDGSIDTLEGATHYRAGDYLVFPGPERRDGWAIEAERFADLYELAAPAQ